MKLAILGFGREGQSLLKFLQKRESMRKTRRIHAKDEIWVLDKNRNIKVPRGIKTQLGKNYLKNLERFDIIFRSPGIPYVLPEIQAYEKRASAYGSGNPNAPTRIISSPTKLFFELASKQTKNIIGITGTKGKGTTSTLLYKILKAAGKDVYLAGNIGTPTLDILPKLTSNSFVVLELSSFQLIDMKRSPHIAVTLMVTSEHLDWHADVKEYVAAKANIVRFQSPNDYAVIAEDYPRSMSYARKTDAHVFTFSRNTEVKKGTWVEHGYFWFRAGKKKEKVCATRELQIPGEHNWENAGAAITVSKILGVKNTAIAKAIRNFRGLEHRLEFVANRKGVKYYNDSYATTPETAEVAIAAFDAPKVLILGGSHKGSDFTRLGRVLSHSKTVKAIIGIGKEWPRIKRHIKNPDIRMIEGCKNMKEIIQKAHAVTAPGDVVLLSPACASFDMFKNYTERGRQFKKLVKQIQ